MNISPLKRVCYENMISLDIIPGPKAPQEIDAFLRPLLNELKLLFNGIDAVLDGSTGQRFKLRAHISIVTGDLPAVSKMTGTMGVSAKSYCRLCQARGYW